MRFTSSRVISTSQQGFTLVEMIIAIGLLAFTALAFTTFELQLVKQIAQSSSLAEADIFRRNIRSLLMNDSAWNQTVLGNPELNACLGAGGCPASSVGFANAQLFTLFDAQGTAVYNARIAQNGVTPNGKPCGPSALFPLNGPAYDFDPIRPTLCPLRYELKWFAITGGVKPQIAIIAPLKISRGFNLSAETNRYSIGSCTAGFISGTNDFVCTNYDNYLIQVPQ